MIAFNDETHLDTSPSDCHRKEARNDQLVGVRRGPRLRVGYRRLEDTRMPVSVRSTRSTKAFSAAPASTSYCRRSLHAAAAKKSDGSRLSARPIAWAAGAIAVLSLKI